ncbi:hypothetical protein GE21DRAFT_1062139 [Neurospora crassa]|nr:hypothetical protein GE21DRAFT_1062139 [Neurospora crassa]
MIPFLIIVLLICTSINRAGNIDPEFSLWHSGMVRPSSNCESNNRWLSMLLVRWSFHPDRHLTPVPTKESWVRWTGFSHDPFFHPTFTSFTKSASHLKIMELSHLVRDRLEPNLGNPDVVFPKHATRWNQFLGSQATSISNPRKGITKPTKQVIDSRTPSFDPSTTLEGPSLS